ncbi:RxLR effector protein [Phytophthora megakarya]|uniref:RxLR effector protein n=1 Tax=Phytophthora megakarya TaxID=4795 RepID=A0A225WR41_9STRA|nr:RxLR effector protein [Phytophthora megakarya]
MRLSCILLAAVSTLIVHQVPVTASVGSDALLTGVMSLEFLHIVCADNSFTDQSRFLRRNKVTEANEEERGLTFAQAIKKVIAENHVKTLVRNQSFSKLDKMDRLVKVDDILDAADKNMASAFQFAQSKNMGADHLMTALHGFKELDDGFINRAVAQYKTFLEKN